MRLYVNMANYSRGFLKARSFLLDQQKPTVAKHPFGERPSWLAASPEDHALPLGYV
jgi:hypothetical protein